MISLPGLIGRVALMVPPLVLALFAGPKLVSGLSVDLAFPVPVFIVTGLQLPQSTYRQTYEVLSGAVDADPSVLITRAEAASRAGMPAAVAVALGREGLKASPAQTRGWLLMAQTVNPAMATRALTMSTYSGPFEYYSLSARVRVTQKLLPYLSGDDRSIALRQVKNFWSQDMFRRNLLQLMSSPGGPQLMSEALRDTPDDIRALNRWLAAESRKTIKRAAKKAEIPVMPRAH